MILEQNEIMVVATMGDHAEVYCNTSISKRPHVMVSHERLQDYIHNMCRLIELMGNSPRIIYVASIEAYSTERKLRDYVCECGKVIFVHNDKYCSYCGAKIKLEGI